MPNDEPITFRPAPPILANFAVAIEAQVRELNLTVSEFITVVATLYGIIEMGLPDESIARLRVVFETQLKEIRHQRDQFKQ